MGKFELLPPPKKKNANLQFGSACPTAKWCQIYVCCEDLEVYHWAMLNLQDRPHKSHLHEISAAPPPHHHRRALQDKTLAGEVTPEKKTGLLVSGLWFHFEEFSRYQSWHRSVHIKEKTCSNGRRNSLSPASSKYFKVWLSALAHGDSVEPFVRDIARTSICSKASVLQHASRDFSAQPFSQQSGISTPSFVSSSLVTQQRK